MKLFLDENLSPQHASELRAEGHDAIAVLEVGLSGATDEQVLRFAVENGRVLVTVPPHGNLTGDTNPSSPARARRAPSLNAPASELLKSPTDAAIP